MVATLIFLLTGMLIWSDWPARTHALTIDIPTTRFFGDHFVQAMESDRTPIHVLSPRANGDIEWNGETITQSELRTLLEYGLMQLIEPGIVFAPEPNASYNLSLRVLAIVKQSGVTKFCFGQLQDHRYFSADEDAAVLYTTYYYPQSTVINLHVDAIDPLPNPPRCSIPQG